MSLSEYRRKRDFRVTPEPRGVKAAGTKRARFVVQKHAASHLHYDFRLELDGVLKSWAVPKGPSLDPAEKRLSVQVEDHPLEYVDFEGVIPEGEYGGGTVMLWDRGFWKPTTDPRELYTKGSLKFVLLGEKLKGAWMLVRRGGRRAAAGERVWFLFKERDEFARSGESITETRPLSVATGRDLEEIAAQADRVWGAKGVVRVRRSGQNSATARSKTASKRSSSSDDPVEFAGVRLTNPDKVVYSDPELTKLDLARYYAEVAPWILPHVVDRPLAVVRRPAGNGKPSFFQKHPGPGLSEHLREVNVAEPGASQPEYHLALDDARGLIALVQMGVQEIHAWGSQRDKLERPDRLVFDLDPDPAVAWPVVVAAARETRILLQELGLESFVKTTGGKGLHVVVPIERRTNWDDAKAFARAVAEFMVAAAPTRYVATMSKATRRGRIFVDYFRNGRGSTAIAPYSTRAKQGAKVSVPIAWEELDAKLRSDHFDIAGVIARLRRLNRDPWAAMQPVRQRITADMFRRLNLDELRGAHGSRA
ncbi:MAG: non-homologous end-joining DNA ligase [Pirellulales bacterium]|nr:non-homologous end-joining DNA ligase [Pirellulales bacterium]